MCHGCSDKPLSPFSPAPGVLSTNAPALLTELLSLQAKASAAEKGSPASAGMDAGGHRLADLDVCRSLMRTQNKYSFQ